MNQYMMSNRVWVKKKSIASITRNEFIWFEIRLRLWQDTNLYNSKHDCVYYKTRVHIVRNSIASIIKMSLYNSKHDYVYCKSRI